MQRVSENDGEYRGGDWGVKYMMRGPKLDWGVILLKPGQAMGAHGHEQVEETFYFVEGRGKIVVDGVPHKAKVGDAFRCEPPEMHDLANDGDADCKIVFIKTPYLPDDKLDPQ